MTLNVSKKPAGISQSLARNVAGIVPPSEVKSSLRTTFLKPATIILSEYRSPHFKAIRPSIATAFPTLASAKSKAVADVNGNVVGVYVPTVGSVGASRGGAGIGAPGVLPKRYSTAAPTFRRFEPTTLLFNPATVSPYDIMINLTS